MPKIQFVSDLHVDFYSRGAKPLNTLKHYLNLEADYLAVAGDISNSQTATVNVFNELAKIYKKVFWVPGNHDLVIPHYYVPSISNSWTYIENICNELPGNVYMLSGEVLNVTENTTIGGSMGYCDFGYAKQVLKAKDEEMWAKWSCWYDSVYIGLNRIEGLQLWESERKNMLSSLKLKPSIMITHFMPSYSLVEKRWASDLCTTFFTFDGNELLKKFGEQGGKIWAYGHTHGKTFTTKHGVSLVCNPFGYPDESKSDTIKESTFEIE